MEDIKTEDREKDAEKEEHLCRICYEPEHSSDDILLSPCACDGTTKWVHRSCLLRWTLESASFCCEICKTEICDEEIRNSPEVQHRIWASHFAVSLSTERTPEELEMGEEELRFRDGTICLQNVARFVTLQLLLVVFCLFVAVLYDLLFSQVGGLRGIGSSAIISGKYCAASTTTERSSSLARWECQVQPSMFHRGLLYERGGCGPDRDVGDACGRWDIVEMNVDCSFDAIQGKASNCNFKLFPNKESGICVRRFDGAMSCSPLYQAMTSFYFAGAFLDKSGGLEAATGYSLDGECVCVKNTREYYYEFLEEGT